MIFYNYILYVYLYGLILVACAWIYSAYAFYAVLMYSKLGTFERKFLSLSWNNINGCFCRIGRQGLSKGLSEDFFVGTIDI